MSFLYWIIVGLIAGAVAHRVLDSRGGFLGSLIVGLIGALVGDEQPHMQQRRDQKGTPLRHPAGSSELRGWFTSATRVKPLPVTSARRAATCP